MPLLLLVSFILNAPSRAADGALRMANGPPIEVSANAVPQGDDLYLIRASGLDILLKKLSGGNFAVAEARWNSGSQNALIAKVFEGSAFAGTDGRLTVELAKLDFGAAGSPVGATLSIGDPADAERIRKLKAMTMAEKVGSLLMKPVGPATYDAVKGDIASGNLGGVLLAWDKFNPSEARKFNADLQALRGASTRRPDVLVSIDHEAGPVFSQRRQGTNFPGSMALGAAGDPALTARAAHAVARELNGQAHLNFGLVADVNTNADNPIIGPRSFGENPQKVAEHVRANVAGYRDSGVVQVAKHFPGHGDTSVDSHSNLPVVPKSVEQLEREEFVPFRAAAQAGIQAMMTAHILLPAIDPDLPATMSAKVVDYLRRKIGFQGVLISDSMDMGAIASKYGPIESSVLAITAGIDILLMGKQDHRAIHEGLLEAVKSDRLPVDRLDEAVLRVLRLKDVLSGSETTPPAETELAQNAALADEIARKAVTLVRDPQGLLPLKSTGQRKFLAVVAQNGNYNAESQEFFSQLRARNENVQGEIVKFRPDAPQIAHVRDMAADADILIIGTYHWGAAEVKEQKTLARALADLGKPMVIISFMSPYDARFLPGSVTVLSTYGLTMPAVRAAAQVIFGELAPTGRSPVTVPGGPAAG